MEPITLEIHKTLLVPKKKLLKFGLVSVISGREKTYVSDIINPEYYEIWFYHNFDFKYVVIGQENFVVDVSSANDSEILEQISDKYNLDHDSDFERIDKLKRVSEFNFFSECWSEVEETMGRKIRCFLIEQGIIRGWDVNKKLPVDGENIGDILNKEGIPNNK